MILADQCQKVVKNSQFPQTLEKIRHFGKIHITLIPQYDTELT